MSDIFREVDEDLRRDRLQRVWKRYGAVIVGIALVVVLATSGYVAWRNWRQSQLAEQTAAMAQALQLSDAEGRPVAADALAALAQDADAGITTLARFYEASLRAQEGDETAAVAIYDEIAASGDVEVVYRDLATLLSVLHQLDSEEPSQLQGRLAALLGETNPWRYSARELNALLSVRAGDLDQAHEQFRALADDPAVPAGLRSRADQLAGLYAEPS